MGPAPGHSGRRRLGWSRQLRFCPPVSHSLTAPALGAARTSHEMPRLWQDEGPLGAMKRPSPSPKPDLTLDVTLYLGLLLLAAVLVMWRF
jgi:hypothetical protein